MGTSPMLPGGGAAQSTLSEQWGLIGPDLQKSTGLLFMLEGPTGAKSYTAVQRAAELVLRVNQGTRSVTRRDGPDVQVQIMMHYPRKRESGWSRKGGAVTTLEGRVQAVQLPAQVYPLKPVDIW